MSNYTKRQSLNSTDKDSKQSIQYKSLIETLNNWNLYKDNEFIMNNLSENYKEIIKIQNKDHRLISILEELGGKPFSEYENIPTSKNDYIIIYFPKADMIKLYGPNELNSFASNIRTHFRNKEYYEVVRDNNRQKIIIIYDDTDQKQLNKLKLYILDFVSIYKLCDIDEQDITIIRNTDNNKSEIILNTYVNNSEEKRNFCNRLMEYLVQKEGDSLMSRTINPDRQGIISNANCYNHFIDIPRRVTDEQLTKILASSIKKCQNMVIHNLYITIGTINGDVNNVTNNYLTSDNSTANINVNTSNMNLGDFVKYIKLGKPEWFDAGKWQHQSDIFQKFKELGGNTSNMKFSMYLKGKLYQNKKQMRLNNANRTAWKLYNWDEI